MKSCEIGNAYLRYLTEGYSPSVAQSVAICSAMRSMFALRVFRRAGLYMHWNVSGESKENTYIVKYIDELHKVPFLYILTAMSNADSLALPSLIAMAYWGAKVIKAVSH